MAYEVVLTEEAEKDIDESILWYEDQQTNLGIRFYFELLKNTSKLKSHPQYYSFIKEEYRQLVIPQFSYKIVFKNFSDMVVVLAIFHTSRNPKDLLKRIK